MNVAIIPVSMSSREIAKLTGKQHKNVVRDIRVMLIELYGQDRLEKIVPEQYRHRHSEYIRENADSILGQLFGDGPDRSHQDSRGFSWSRDKRGYLAEFRLDRELTETLLTGYSTPLRHRVIRRLRELESVAVRGDPVEKVVKVEAAPVAALVDLARLTFEHLPNLSENSKQAFLSAVTEKALGHKVIPLPKIEHHLMPAGEVGTRLGISGAMVGRIANANGLKVPQYGEFRLDKSKHSSKQVESFVYNEAGLERLRQLLAEKVAA